VSSEEVRQLLVNMIDRIDGRLDRFEDKMEGQVTDLAKTVAALQLALNTEKIKSQTNWKWIATIGGVVGTGCSLLINIFMGK
jgi:hypothetical protein